MEDTTNNPMIRTVIHKKSGSRFDVHDMGATVLSFIPSSSSGRECLFVSRDAILDGSKAIRGGIPLVFPQFGPLPDTSMPQHGFLRNNLWTFLERFEEDESAGMTYTLQLQDVKTARGTEQWNPETTELDCSCRYTIKVDATKLTTTLSITNTSETTAFPFQTLQHTYLKVEDHAAYDPSQCYVKGLQGYSVQDKITSEEEYICQDDSVVLVDNVDRVYNSNAAADVNVTVGVGGSLQMQLTATTTDDNVPVSCVVWNPYEEKAKGMSDFGNDQYADMICVEPGVLQSKTPLEPGKTTTLTQTIELVQVLE